MTKMYRELREEIHELEFQLGRKKFMLNELAKTESI